MVDLQEMFVRFAIGFAKSHRDIIRIVPKDDRNVIWIGIVLDRETYLKAKEYLRKEGLI